MLIVLMQKILPIVGFSTIALLGFFLLPQNTTARRVGDVRHRLERSPITKTLDVNHTGTPLPTISLQPAISRKLTETELYIINAINAYRKSQGLAAVQTDDVTCSFATIRAKEIATNFSHDGFNERVKNNTLLYKNYALITENIAETSNYKNVVDMWAASAPHAENMRADTPYVCIAQYDNYFAYEGWKPL